MGAFDKTLIEFKLAKSSTLEKNMKGQVEIYEKANKTDQSVFVVICYTKADLAKTARVMKKLGVDDQDAKHVKKVVVIDATSKESASKV